MAAERRLPKDEQDAVCAEGRMRGALRHVARDVVGAPYGGRHHARDSATRVRRLRVSVRRAFAGIRRYMRRVCTCLHEGWRPEGSVR